MKPQMFRCVFVINFVTLVMLGFVFAQDITSESIGNTTEKNPLVGSLENIVSKVQSMKAKIEKILIDKSISNVVEKTRQNVLTKKGYQFTDGIGYHRLYLTKLSWHDALHFCRKENAHLTVIESLAERDAIEELVKESLSSAPDIETLAYIGIHDYSQIGSWITIFFDIVDKNAEFIRWQEKSPNYIVGQENCAAIDKDGIISTLECVNKHAFVCETEL